MSEAIIKGTGRYVPENIVTNDDLAKFVDTSDEWISSRTGIKQRHISEKENTSEIAYHAAKEALEDAGIQPEELDLIILATVTPDAFTPSTACIVQAKLGAINAAAFDINAACSGFIYALDIATQFIRTGVYKNVLVIGAEVLSKIVNWKDRNTCVLFGDGAGAALISASEERGIGKITIHSDGRKGDVLKCNALPLNNLGADKNEEKVYNSFVTMEGKEVFKFAGGVIVDTIKNVTEVEGISIDDISRIIPHQANYRIIDFAARKLNLDINKFYINLDKYGNTSSASVPIALDELNRAGALKKGDKIVLVAFGGGLTSGAALINWMK